jgi:hypothetical protein
MAGMKKIGKMPEEGRSECNKEECGIPYDM